MSLRPTVAPRCQHTCNAVLLRVDDVGALFGVEVAVADIIVGDGEFRPHVSRPSSDEPMERNNSELFL